MSNTIELCIFELVLISIFSLKWQFWFFGTILLKNGFPVKNRNSEQNYWIVHTWVSLGMKFQITQPILIFWAKFTLKGYFKLKTEKVDITVELFKVELVHIRSFSLNWQFLFFGQNLSKNVISGLKQKNHIFTCVDGRYLLYWAFLHGERQT